MYYGINNKRPIYSERAHQVLQNPKFHVNWANIEQDTAKVKNDHRSKFPNLSNWKEEA